MKKEIRRIIFLSLFLFGIFVFFFFIFIQYDKNRDFETKDNLVVRVIDGDTFELYNGEIVRLICIDSPEKGKEGYDEAKNYLSFLILNKEVRLEKDVNDKDIYGRLLRYVYVDDIFVNKEMVEKNYAKIFRFGNDTMLCDEIES